MNARNASYEILKNAMDSNGGDFPEIRLGCEVHLKNNIDEMKDLVKLAVDGTDYILLEMPYTNWKPEIFELVYNISILGVKPIMAHIERFLKHRRDFYNLKSVGALFQLNADAFLHKSMRKELLDLFYDGYAHVMGSDMHNTEDRVNNLKSAYQIIEKYYGKEFAEVTENNARRILDNKSPLRTELPKLGFIKKIRL